MYDEFTTKTGIDCDYKTYETVVEVVYRNLPNEVYGGNYNTDFCQWVKTNGGMKIIEALYPLCMKKENSEETIKTLKGEIANYRRMLDECAELEQDYINQIKVYQTLVPKEALVAELMKMNRETLIRLIAREVQ